MKKYFILFVLLLSVTPIFAQSDDGEMDFSKKENPFGKPKSNALFLGPKVGATFTSMGQPNEVNLYDGSGAGFSGGLSMKARFGKATENSIGGTGFWGVGLELKYKENNVKTIGSDDLSLGYFEIPVMAQVYPFAKSKVMNSFYVELGPDFAGTLSKSPETLNVSSANISYKTGDLKGFDVRVMVGLGYTLPNTGLDINARYYLGTSELAENFPCKMNSVEVSLAWMFSIGKF